ncbi:MAG: extracellular solute-binding protein [Caldicoprobacterales bacterium]
MKKVVFLLLVMCVILSACTPSTGNVGDEDKKTPTPDPTEVGKPTTEPSAKGSEAELYNDNLSYLEENIVTYFSSKGEADKMSPYDTPIPVSVTNWYSPTIENAFVKFEEKYGETFEANRWTDAFKRALNLDVTYKWWAADADYNQKLRLDMTANDLPDIFLVRSQTDLIQMAQSGAIHDLTDLFDTWATEDDKEVWESDGGALLQMASYENRIYGLPSSISDTDNFSYLWIRSDWMTKLGLEYPKTMDELADVIEAFVNADMDGNGVNDTVGLVVDKGLFYSTRAIFNAFQAYPEIWVKTSDDQLIWGGTTDANKDALNFLGSLYEKGYIDPEFITKSGSDALESVISGKCGVAIGGHWLGHTMGDLHELDEESDWRCIPIPTGTGDVVKSPLKPTHHGWLVVNSNFEHPEAAFKMRGLHTYTLKDKDAAWWWYEENITWQISPVRANVSAYDNLFTYLNLLEAYNNNNDTSLLRAKAISYWANLHGELAWEWEMMFGPEDKTPMNVLNDAYSKDLLFYDAFLGPQSAFMQERWSTIMDEQLVAFTKMIINEVSVEKGFEDWKNTFINMGGDRITEEVNDWYESIKN